ncbi:helix-turn-helix domain-containing protein [Promicromonospora thailandica]|uniref:Helix-turn-helix domain-containing protein n=1 Tax=Promicromonospora thailandica TaxID=765201 RepID=A0A9X2G2X5_9MICO|nr:helix-turn-helix transcriptional regulator [Promicromonospora thailandica]MCP2264493.1 Helix-turn-helix domain-containing protein [Promicromonospora thailandica]
MALISAGAAGIAGTSALGTDEGGPGARTGTFEHAREPLLRDLVGTILRRTRREQRRTLADVAAAARVSTAYLSEVERGRKEASSEVLAAVCESLGMRLVDLVERAWADLAIAYAEQEEGRRVRVLSSAARRSAGFSASRHPLGASSTGAVGRRGRAVLQAA